VRASSRRASAPDGSGVALRAPGMTQQFEKQSINISRGIYQSRCARERVKNVVECGLDDFRRGLISWGGKSKYSKICVGHTFNTRLSWPSACSEACGVKLLLPRQFLTQAYPPRSPHPKSLLLFCPTASLLERGRDLDPRLRGDEPLSTRESWILISCGEAGGLPDCPADPFMNTFN